jgi:hypothetical protein
VLLISEPVRNMVNSIFWMKMILLVAAIVVSLTFQHSIRARAATWEVSPTGHLSLRISAVAILLLWCAVIAGGRWIAYAPS